MALGHRRFIPSSLFLLPAGVQASLPINPNHGVRERSLVASVGSDQFRSLYADLVTAGSGGAQSRLKSAFGLVPRERFLGPGPWKIFAGARYIETPSSHPAFVYQDVVIAISQSKGLNNGQPSLHARCLGALAPRQGEEVLHIGAGTGYYTAILAELVGATGRVQAMEIDKDLARAAKLNLKDYPNVFVRSRSGAKPPLPPSDIIYVNAGSTAPLRVWLDALRFRGRLIFPLTPGNGRGAMLRVTKTEGGLAADFVCDAYFVPCVGAQVGLEKRRLTQAFDQGGGRRVRRLYLDRSPDDTCWLRGNSWWLSTRPI